MTGVFGIFGNLNGILVRLLRFARNDGNFYGDPRVKPEDDRELNILAYFFPIGATPSGLFCVFPWFWVFSIFSASGLFKLLPLPPDPCTTVPPPCDAAECAGLAGAGVGCVAGTFIVTVCCCCAGLGPDPADGLDVVDAGFGVDGFAADDDAAGFGVDAGAGVAAGVVDDAAGVATPAADASGP